MLPKEFYFYASKNVAHIEKLKQHVKKDALYHGISPRSKNVVQQFLDSGILSDVDVFGFYAAVVFSWLNNNPLSNTDLTEFIQKHSFGVNHDLESIYKKRDQKGRSSVEKIKNQLLEQKLVTTKTKLELFSVNPGLVQKRHGKSEFIIPTDRGFVCFCIISCLPLSCLDLQFLLRQFSIIGAFGDSAVDLNRDVLYPFIKTSLVTDIARSYKLISRKNFIENTCLMLSSEFEDLKKENPKNNSVYAAFIEALYKTLLYKSLNL